MSGGLLMKDIEDMEKKQDKIDKTLNSILEFLRKNLVTIKFVEEVLMIDVTFVDRTVHCVLKSYFG